MKQEPALRCEHGLWSRDEEALKAELWRTFTRVAQNGTRAIWIEVVFAMVLSHSHTSFTVSDLERSIAFYTDVLGMERGRRWERVGPEIESIVGVKGARLKMATVVLQAFTLELIQYAASGASPINPKINQPGTAHIAFEVEDVDRMCERLRSQGVRFYGTAASLPPPGSPAGTRPPPGVRAVYLADPDGITIEIAQRLR